MGIDAAMSVILVQEEVKSFRVIAGLVFISVLGSTHEDDMLWLLHEDD